MGAAGTEAKTQNLGMLEVRRHPLVTPLWSVPQASLPSKAAIDANGPERDRAPQPA